jgi:3-dehydroquinate synthase
MAVDLIYARNAGWLKSSDCERILDLMRRIGFPQYDAELDRRDSTGEWAVWRGLEDFREHLGGELTITMVTAIGSKIEIHQMERNRVAAAVDELRARAG